METKSEMIQTQPDTWSLKKRRQEDSSQLLPALNPDFRAPKVGQPPKYGQSYQAVWDLGCLKPRN